MVGGLEFRSEPTMLLRLKSASLSGVSWLRRGNRVEGEDEDSNGDRDAGGRSVDGGGVWGLA